ncbi:MAG: DHA2 family efflux MFS transporter permease subunit [Verrucomicrobiota bacterium]
MAESNDVSFEKWVALMGVMLGAFMAVLDIQITNASLNNIAGALGSSVDEGSWISTAYLVAEIVVIGVSGIFADIFSTKRYLLFSAVGFVIFSVACAFAQNLSTMILFRALQGLTGGALIPLAFNVNLKLLPPAKRSIGMAVFGMTATMGPALGPAIGGWLTDNYGWQWIFFVNVPPGIAMIAIIWALLPGDKMNLERLRVFDWPGVLAMAIGLGSLEYVLEEGQRKDWFGNETILRCTWLAAIFIPLFLIRELTARYPFLDFRVFLNRNFSASCVVMVALGAGLYGSIYLVPLYLGQYQGYSPTLIGATLMWVGLPQLVIIPFLPLLQKLLDVRIIIAIGLVLFAGSCYMNAFMDPDFSGPQITMTNIIRALGQPLTLIPLLSVATATIPKAQSGSASAVFNMLRNLGGSIGIAMLSTATTWRENLHSQRIVETVTPETLVASARIQSMNQIFLGKGLDPTTAMNDAVLQLGNEVKRQAAIMAYSDCFWILAMLLFGSGFSLLLLPKTKIGAEAHAA